MRSKLLILVLIALAVSGCISERKHELLAANPSAPPPVGVAAKHDIFVATTRRKADDLRVVFGRDRSDTLAFARVGMTVPKDHQIGMIERAKDGTPGDPAKDFTATDLTIFDSGAAFTTAVANEATACWSSSMATTPASTTASIASPRSHTTRNILARRPFLLGFGRQDARLCLRQGQQHCRPRRPGNHARHALENRRA